MQARFHHLTNARDQLRSQVVQNPGLAADIKIKAEMGSLLIDHELAAAALEGLRSKELTLRRAASSAKHHAEVSLPGLLTGVVKLRAQSRADALLEFVRSWGPGQSTSRFVTDLSEIASWCRRCCEAERLMQTLTGWSEANPIPPDNLQAVIDFVAEELAELTPPVPDGAVAVAAAPALKAAA